MIQFFLNNPVKVSVGVLLVALFGVVALMRMPMALTPEVETPTISIETKWPGASPQEIEQEIVVEQEEQLKSVEGISKMTSESSDSQAKITLEFLVGTNMDEALLKVNSRLAQVPDYPEDADQPVITTANSSDRPIAWFVLSARRPSDAEYAELRKMHPELKEAIDEVQYAPNIGVQMLKLRRAAEKYPEFQELMPPESLDIQTLKRFAEDEIEARFERVKGVSQSNVIGGLEDEIQVIVHPERLAARSLTVSDVRRVLSGQNEDTSAGDFWEGKRRWVVRTLGQFRTPEQVENQLLAVRDGVPVYVRDIGEVQHGYKKPTGIMRRFGESAIGINCVRETNANVLDVMDGLRHVCQELDEGLLKSRGLQLVQVYDETDYIYSSVDLVRQNIFIGGALTICVLMLFLHLGARTLLLIPPAMALAIASATVSGWLFIPCLILLITAGFWFARGALVVALAIPTSIIGTFLILGVLGRSLNVISLAGLAFAVGMLVDNAVVVLENIYRHYQMGEPPLKAASKGTQEVWGAVFASTATTVAVFLPIVFIQEEAGQLFRDIALAISAAVALSLVVSMSVIPTAASRLFHRTPKHKRGAIEKQNGQLPRHANAAASGIEAGISNAGSSTIEAIVSLNRWLMGSVTRRVAIIALILVGTVGISWALWPKVEYLPTGNRNLVFGILLPPPGYNIDQLMTLGETVEEELKPYWDVDPTDPAVQNAKYPAISDFFFVARGRQVFMGLRTYDDQRCGELVPLVASVGAKLPGTFAVAKQSSLFERGLTAGRTVEIEITGPELDKLVELGGEMLMRVKGAGPFTGKGLIPDAQVRPVPSLDLSSPELHIEPKLVQAAEMGVSSADLGYTANALIDGAYAGDYFLDGKKIDLTIIGETNFADSTQKIGALPIATPGGELVPLAALADVNISSGPEQINHRERLRSIAIEVSPPEMMPLENAMQLISTQLVDPMVAEGKIPAGYRVGLSGTADKLTDTWKSLWVNVVLALVITYLLMAALFESWIYPFVIILSVPLGAVGGVMALALLNLFYFQSLDVLTMLGFVILIGTVVNNPILIVHQALNHMREDGMDLNEAVLESVRSRIRPIFMTTMTTVLGLMPLVLFPGSGSELYRGLGSVVLGGLLVSTFLTLILVPSLFSLTVEAYDALVAPWRRDEDDDLPLGGLEDDEFQPHSQPEYAAAPSHQ
ncbi:AcrB/AcrD/AcrF family protein [Blastopirellula marina]|uniref:AcrB/AcrD/AcrF family protein n=1 Tax=Blastopirellula marina TaxID=124 RepID=A0A2S8F174_9BACT|nr:MULTISPECIES: efflux RND transporter permease subunit [Pirellulaceae]PQO25922.1 AcrB/AcrD/AcrF family protein [Blastopirellula marina]RCS44280.1 AcrB/AcrD/AcrF family protein [Bremerella cremea]